MNAHARNMPEPLPDAIEAEQALLGAILHDNQAYWRVAGFLKPDHFDGGERGANGQLYSVMGSLITEGRPVTAITVKSHIRADQVISQNGGDNGEPLTFYRYVVRLFAEAVTTINAYEYGRAVLKAAGQRNYILLLQDGIERVRHLGVKDSLERAIGDTAAGLTALSRETDERAASLKYGVILPQAVTKVAQAADEASTLIPWFLPEATAVAGNIRRGNLIGFMSDSGGGKTSFSLAQCRHAALQGFKSAFFSIEITEEEAALQAAAQAARVPLSRLDGWTVQTREAGDIEREIELSMDLPLDIVPFAECRLEDIAIKIEAMVKSTGLDFVAIDHAKMITLPNPKDMFAERVNALYRGLKAIAKRLHVAIMILIQRNEEWKARWKSGGSLRPMMGDAYGGGSVKQNLDVWFSLYRPEPLYKELIPQERNETKRIALIKSYEDARGKAWLINHKRRRGEPMGSQVIDFIHECTRFQSPFEAAQEAEGGELFA